MTRTARQSAERADRAARETAWIVAALSQHGPLPAADLAALLGLNQRRVGWHLSQLVRRGLVEQDHRWLSRQRCYRSWWSLTAAGDARTAPPAPAVRTAERASKIGIDADDLEWMDYWRQRRIDRQARRPGSAA